MWTSGQSLRVEQRLEFCSILNRALFLDPPDAAQHIAVVAHALKTLCVVRGVREVSR
jgi:hypothetical protein